MAPKSERNEPELSTDETPAERYVNLLLTEGTKISCDETNDSFNHEENYPSYYDEALFRRGQQFFHYHISGMFFNKLTGLLVVMGIPSILKILIATNMSSSDKTAYRRYMATILHILQWYDKDFKPGTEAWNSLLQVRRMHNAASKKFAKKLNRITQADMVLTQFGFCGFALVRSKKVGIHTGTEEDWAAFLHFWRVIGWMLGIEDRFNLCQGTVQESRELFNLLLERVLKPCIERKNNEFLAMSRYMMNGMWCMVPILQYEAALNYLWLLLQEEHCDADDVSPSYFQLTSSQNFLYHLAFYILGTLFRYNWFRIVYNQIIFFSIWSVKYLPLLAYYQFGLRDTRVVLDLKTKYGFNLCQQTVDESRTIFNLLIHRVYRPYIEKRSNDFLTMTKYMLNGMWCMTPNLQYEATLSYLWFLLQEDNCVIENVNPHYFQLTAYQRFKLHFTHFVLCTLFAYNWFRVFHNYVHLLSIWLMKYFPFLAYYEFGFRDTRVVLNLKKYE